MFIKIKMKGKFPLFIFFSDFSKIRIFSIEIDIGLYKVLQDSQHSRFWRIFSSGFLNKSSWTWSKLKTKYVKHCSLPFVINNWKYYKISGRSVKPISHVRISLNILLNQTLWSTNSTWPCFVWFKDNRFFEDELFRWESEKVEYV